MQFSEILNVFIFITDRQSYLEYVVNKTVTQFPVAYQPGDRGAGLHYRTGPFTFEKTLNR